MVKWSKVCRSKSKGGLVLKISEKISLLVKWWWKLDTQDGLWQIIVKARYLRNKTIANVIPRFSDPPVGNLFYKSRTFILLGGECLLEEVTLSVLGRSL
jgi:hypothetical protein